MNQLETDGCPCPRSLMRCSLTTDTNGGSDTSSGWPATSKCAIIHSISLGVRT